LMGFVTDSVAGHRSPEIGIRILHDSFMHSTWYESLYELFIAVYLARAWELLYKYLLAALAATSNEMWGFCIDTVFIHSCARDIDATAARRSYNCPGHAAARSAPALGTWLQDRLGRPSTRVLSATGTGTGGLPPPTC